MECMHESGVKEGKIRLQATTSDQLYLGITMSPPSTSTIHSHQDAMQRHAEI